MFWAWERCRVELFEVELGLPLEEGAEARLARLAHHLRVLGRVAAHGHRRDQVGQDARLRRDALDVDHVRLDPEGLRLRLLDLVLARFHQLRLAIRLALLAGLATRLSLVRHSAALARARRAHTWGTNSGRPRTQVFRTLEQGGTPVFRRRVAAPRRQFWGVKLRGFQGILVEKRGEM